MEFCLLSKDRDIWKVLVAVSLVMCFWLLKNFALINYIIWIPGFTLALIFHWFTWRMCIVYNRRYTIDKNALVLVGITGKVVRYDWNQFGDVGICKVHYTAKGPIKFDTVIRCTIGHESAGPQEGFYGFWATEIYEALHLKNVFIISFSEKRIQQFCELCPLEIKDYRFIKKSAYDNS